MLKIQKNYVKLFQLRAFSVYWVRLSIAFFFMGLIHAQEPDTTLKRYLYVASPGIRNYLEYGGHGVIVLDIDDSHSFVKRIPTGGLAGNGDPENVKGFCASAVTQRMYVSTYNYLICINLVTDEVVWEKSYDLGFDRMSISPNGEIIYQPSLERDYVYVIDALMGDEITRLQVESDGTHNLNYSLDGDFAYLGGLRSTMMTVLDARNHEIVKTVGPFSGPIRPFTINGRHTRTYVTVNDVFGFEVGDLESGEMIHSIVIQDYETGPVARHGNPTHGIGMTNDEKEIWVIDGHNEMVHVFDATVEPPVQGVSIQLNDFPGWITFGIDGALAYPSTGDVIDTKTYEIIDTLWDEEGRQLQSEKLLEIDFRDGVPVTAGNQFGVGRVIDTIPDPVTDFSTGSKGNSFNPILENNALFLSPRLKNPHRLLPHVISLKGQVYPLVYSGQGKFKIKKALSPGLYLIRIKNQTFLRFVS